MTSQGDAMNLKQIDWNIIYRSKQKPMENTMKPRMNSMKNKGLSKQYSQPELIEAGIQAEGFTLTEILISVAIVGLLSSIALPSYFRQIQSTCQAEAASNLNLLASSASAYKDIHGKSPKNWHELNEISAVMTTEGSAKQSRFASVKDEDGKELNPYALKEALENEITTPGCDYKLSRSSERSDDQFIFTAVPTPNTGDKAAFNVVSCFDLSNGASDLKRGNKDVQGAATSTDLVCWK